MSWVMRLGLWLFVALAVPSCGPRSPGPSSECPGGRTTDGDCCRSGCACGASCISCANTCHALAPFIAADGGR